MAGWRPSLVFEGRLIEDGQPLLITNLDLETERPEITYVEGHLRELSLPTCVGLVCGGDFALPAQVLPCQPRRRVRAVRPSSGNLSPLLGWIDACLNSEDARAWLHSEVSGILLLELRTTVGQTGTVPVLRGLEEVTGPFELTAREDQAMEGVALRSLAARLTGQIGAGGLKHASFALDIGNSSWLLSTDELEHVRGSAKAAESSLAMASILRWWQEHVSSQVSHSANE
jgi:hypothetical protein